jgi:hypothetical protein
VDCSVGSDEGEGPARGALDPKGGQAPELDVFSNTAGRDDRDARVDVDPSGMEAIAGRYLDDLLCR